MDRAQDPRGAQAIERSPVLMEALLKDGFTIHEIDMIEDGRRLRGSNKLH